MRCDKRIHLKGGFYYTVRRARDDYQCFFCGGAIPRGVLYVEERSLGNVVRRYHYKCFNKVMPHKLKTVEVPSGVVICEV
jgi:ribosomal protein L24E